MDEQLVASRSKVYTEKFFMFIMFLAPCLLLFNFAFQNDTYWLIKMGEYIVKNGFPVTDPLTMHSGLNFTPQQWLTTVIFYLLYSKFGAMSLYILDIVLYFIMIIVIYAISMNVSGKNRYISLVVTVFTCLFISFYIVPRPQVFSILIFILEIYFLEKFIQTDRIAYLFFLPVLSVLLVNLHSAMWLFFFVMYVPYLLDGLNIRLWVIKTHGYRFVPVLSAFLVSFAAGFLNPYGLGNMFYVIYSYGNSRVSSSVTEMASPNFKEIFGIMVFVLVLILVLIYIIVKSDNRLRYTLITIGTLYMGLSSVRSFVLLLGCAVPLLAYYMRNIEFPNISFGGRRKYIKYILIAAILAILVFALCAKKYDFSDTEDYFRPIGAVNFLEKNEDTSKIRLYNEYNTGGYIEFRGIKAFIDSRAEVFLKSLNKKDDIILDYLNARSGSLHYRNFIKKYSFTHFLLGKGDNLNVYLREDPDYKNVYEDDKFIIYKTIK